AFGVDELFLAALDWTNIARGRAFQIPVQHKKGFQVHLETQGRDTACASIVWDGNDLTLISGALVGTPTSLRTCPTDSVIDVIRGRMECALLGRIPQAREDGDLFLLYCLGLKFGMHANLDVYESMMDFFEERRLWQKRVREQATDPCEYF